MVVLLIELAITGVLVVFLLAKKGTLTTDAAILLTCGTIFGHAFYSVAAGPLPLTFPRLWTGWIFARWLWDYARGRHALSRWGVAEIGLYGFLLFIAVQLSQTHWQYNEKKPLAFFLFFLLLPASVYFALSNSRISIAELKKFRWIIVAFGLYLAVTAILETKGPSALVFPRYIMSSEFPTYLGRARGPFLNPVANGVAMTMGIAAAASFWPVVQRRGKIAIAGYIGVAMIGVFLTYTRSCWAGAVLGLGGFILWHLPPRARVATLCIGLVVGLPVLIKVKEFSSSFKRDKEVTVEQMEESAALRPLLARVAWEMIRNNPWTGVGYGQHAEHNEFYIQSAETDLPIQKAAPYVQHNSVLSLMVETGVFGTSLFALFAFGSVATALRVASNVSIPWEMRCVAWIQLAMLASMGFNSAWHDVLVEDGAFQIWTVLAGLTMAVQRTTQEVPQASHSSTQPTAQAPTARTPAAEGSPPQKNAAWPGPRAALG